MWTSWAGALANRQVSPKEERRWMRPRGVFLSGEKEGDRLVVTRLLTMLLRYVWRALLRSSTNLPALFQEKNEGIDNWIFLWDWSSLKNWLYLLYMFHSVDPFIHLVHKVVGGSRPSQEHRGNPDVDQHPDSSNTARVSIAEANTRVVIYYAVLFIRVRSSQRDQLLS